MHRPTFLGRSLSHLRLTEQTTHHIHRVFSTTPSRFFPDDSSNEPNARQRAAAAAAAAGNLSSQSSSDAAPKHGINPLASAAGVNPVAPRKLSHLPLRNMPTDSTPGSTSARGGVISLKALPGRGGGAKFPGPGGASAPRFLIRREAMDGPARGGGDRGRGRGRGGMRGRGGRGRGRGMRGRGRGGRGGAAGKERDEGDNMEEDDGADETMPAWTPEGGAYIDSLEDRSVPKIYNPTLTAGDLEGYGPAVASTGTTNKSGRTEAVLRNMRLLGGGVPFCGDIINPEMHMEAAREGRATFFDTLREREFAKLEDGAEYPGPAEETKKALLNAAVGGKYEVTKEGLGDNNPYATMGRYLDKIPGYQPKDVEKTLSKLKELVR